MLQIIKVGTVGFIIYEGLKCLNQKNYADIVGFVTLMNVGFGVYFKVGTWYEGLMNSRIIELFDKIF